MGSRVWLSGQNALMQNFSAGTNTWRLTIFFDFLNENRKDQRLKGFREGVGGRVWDALEKG